MVPTSPTKASVPPFEWRGTTIAACRCGAVSLQHGTDLTVRAKLPEDFKRAQGKMVERAHALRICPAPRPREPDGERVPKLQERAATGSSRRADPSEQLQAAGPPQGTFDVQIIGRQGSGRFSPDPTSSGRCDVPAGAVIGWEASGLFQKRRNRAFGRHSLTHRTEKALGFSPPL